MGWYDETFRASVVLVATSVGLVFAGLGGFGSSVGLVGVFTVLAGALSALREQLADALAVAGHDLGEYAGTLWLAPLLAAVVCLLFLGSTPAELQALGGVVGLAGMVNYFLRPVYRAGYAVVRFVARTVS